MAPRRFARCGGLTLTTSGGEAIEATVATGPVARLLGLARLEPDRLSPLLLPGCRAVHGIGMRAELDVCFLAMPPLDARRATVLAIVAPMGRRGRATLPRALRGERPARSVAALELPAGTARALGIEPGVNLTIGHAGASRT